MSAATERQRAADVAAGRAAADVAIVGATVVDVYMRRLRQADVALSGHRIAAVGDVAQCIDESTKVIDCGGLYLMPGFVEPHLHVAFSQVSVERLAELLLPLGTVAISACFSESTSIVGAGALDEQHERSLDTGLDLLPSAFHASVTSPHLERYEPDELLAMIEDHRCVELREWGDRVNQMEIEGLDGGASRLWREALRHKRTIAGHLAGQHGGVLQASAALGVRSDHETTTIEEALRRVELGIAVQMRQGSAGRDLHRLLPAITEHEADPDLFSFCSDEQELHDIVENGHLDGKLRVAVEHGVPAIEAVRMATLNAARSMGIEFDYGAVVPGRFASLVLTDDLRAFRPAYVFSHGVLMADSGTYTGPVSSSSYPNDWNATVNLARELEPADFKLKIDDGKAAVRVIGYTAGSLFTDELIEATEVRAGSVGRGSGLAKLALIDRHQASGRMAVGLIRGLDLKNGALASTVNAGSFNLMVVGVDDEAMAMAANRAADLNGGTVVTSEGQVQAEIALPLFGLVSHAPLAESIDAAAAVAEAIREKLGSPLEGFAASVGFTCLPGFPSLKMTENGLVRTRPGGVSEAVELEVGG